MGTIIETDGDFDPAITLGIILPVDDIIGLNVFGGSAAVSRNNLADSSKPSTVVGAPTFTSNYMTASGNGNYMQSGLSEAPGMTLFAIARANTATGTSARVISNKLDGAGSGLTLFFPISGNTVGATCNYTDAPGTEIPVFTPVSDKFSWQVAVARYDGTGHQIFNKTPGGSGGSNSVANTSGRRIGLETQTIRYGSRIFDNSNSISDIAVTAIANRALTNTEIDEMCALLIQEAQAKGITF